MLNVKGRLKWARKTKRKKSNQICRTKARRKKNPRLAKFDDFKNVPRGTCRWCHGPVHKPRIYYCSDSCLNEIAVRVNWGAAVRAVVLRDKGICAKCGLDCRALKRQIRLEGNNSLIRKYRIPKYLASKRLWQCDHIRPVKDGGGGCGIENLQTLCWRCHKKKTLHEQKTRHKSTVTTKRRRH